MRIALKQTGVSEWRATVHGLGDAVELVSVADTEDAARDSAVQMASSRAEWLRQKSGDLRDDANHLDRRARALTPPRHTITVTKAAT